MFGDIKRLWRDDHQEAQRNLPWRFSGDLDADATGRFDAHLETCVQCRADLRLETQLRSQQQPQPQLNADAGWAQMTKRLAPRPARIAPPPRAAAAPRWQGWAIAAQFLVIFGLSAALLAPRAQQTQYHALSAGPTVEAGNMLVIFGPQTPELSMRRLLQQADARVVDGPNAAGAYVLRVPAERRAAVLKVLQNRSEVILAQPVDAGDAP